MAVSYRRDNITRPVGDVVTYGASKACGIVSGPFAMSYTQARDFTALVEISAATLTNAITFSLQHSRDAGVTWHLVGDQSQASVAAAITFAHTDITVATEVINKTSHGLVTGDKVIFTAATTAPTGLTSGARYYVITVDANNFKLASTSELAWAGTAINLTAAGSGNMTVRKAQYTIRMYAADATDLAQLPIQSPARIVVTTGASDSVTVAGAWVAGFDE